MISLPPGEYLGEFSALGIAGGLNGELYQAIGGAVDQPPPRAVVHAARSADIGLRPADRTDRSPGYRQLEVARLYPDLVGADLHARSASAPGEVTLDESINMAFLVVLESMAPAERVAFILHDVFRYPFAEIAEIVGRTPAACRQLASSARRRIRASQAPPTPTARQAAIVRAFKAAWEAKDIDALIGLLDPNATAIADGGGLATTFLRPIEGGEQIARAWIEIAHRAPSNRTFLERTVNGQPGLVAQENGVTMTVFAFDVAGDRIKHIWAVRNPEKLRPWTTG
jgi:RNA polymerase sigma-70 factor (ECF subfamily)